MKVLKSNEFWGRRSGAVKIVTIKGVEREERSFKQGQWGNGRENNSPKKRNIGLIRSKRGASS